MLCPLCHTPNRDNAKFCKVCGGLLATEVVAAGAHAQAEPSAATPLQEIPPVSSSSPDAASTMPASVEKQQPDTSAPAEALEPTVVDATVYSAAGGNAVDPALAPTQFLSPQQMLAFHARRQQQEAERAHQQQHQATDIADIPTMRFSSPPAGDIAQSAPAADAAPSPHSDVADMPTIITAPSEEATQLAASTETDATLLSTASSAPAEDTVPPSVTAEESQPPTSTPTTPEAIPAKLEEEDSLEHASNPHDQRTTTPSISTLPVGTTIGDRYIITDSTSATEAEQLYEVTDQKGYLHCWNCGWEENAEGTEFCDDCGAELQHASYVMHAYPANASPSNESHMLQGTIIDTLVEQGYTFVIEKPLTSQSSFPNGVRLLASCDSDAGNLRRADPNEDSTFVLLFERVHESIATPAGIFIVADGMGGHDNGQGASRLTTAVIAERVVRELLMPPLSAEKAGEPTSALDEDALLSLVHGSVEDANTALCQLNQREKSDMGSTLTGFLLVNDHAYIFNVGDSRTYMLRDQQLYQVTSDHSLVGQLVAGGLITPEEVYTHPQRSQIYRSIGDKLNVQIDVFQQQVHPGDVLLSCSDGLWEMVRDPQITDILNNAHDPQTACTQLIEAANTNGGEDNVSAVVVFVR